MGCGRSIGTGFLKNDYVLRGKLDLEKFFQTGVEEVFQTGKKKIGMIRNRVRLVPFLADFL